MKFFKPEDFYSKTIIQKYIGPPVSGKTISVKDACDYANDKLEKDCIQAFGWLDENGFAFHKQINGITAIPSVSTHTALIFNIESIDVCEHPKDKIKAVFAPNLFSGIGITQASLNTFTYQCECGKVLEPIGFKNVCDTHRLT